VGGVTSTAITGPGAAARITFTGTLLSTAPSTRRSPHSDTTGGRTPGTEKLARTHFATGPSRCTTSSAFVRLADTQKNGSRMSSIRASPKHRSSARREARPESSATSGRV